MNTMLINALKKEKQKKEKKKETVVVEWADNGWSQVWDFFFFSLSNISELSDQQVAKELSCLL